MTDAFESHTMRTAFGADPEASDVGLRMHDFIREMYPICRSITGQGIRETYDLIGSILPLKRTGLRTGTPVFDWEIPREWNIRDAYVKDSSGKRIIDFRESNLHVVNYSSPVRAEIDLEELRPHLHTLPEHPDWIPYRTSYYRDDWGFCLSQKQYDMLVPGRYEVRIDSSLDEGELVIAESVFEGETQDEVLVWTHACHPSLCNDNLSAIAVATELALRVAARPRRFTYRFVFAPATIGSIAWLKLNEDRAGRIRHGLVLASLGDRGRLTYKRSRLGNADIDRATAYVVENGHDGTVEDFSPYGYDERQFCSPGFNLPVGRLTRTPNGCYPEYHTSADDLNFITPGALSGSLEACEEILFVIETNRRYVNLAPKCEPRLGKRGLFNMTGGQHPGEFEHGLLWVLSASDGACDLLAIAQRAGLAYRLIVDAADALLHAGLIAPEELTDPAEVIA